MSTVDADYTFKIGDHRFGFVDTTFFGIPGLTAPTHSSTYAELGPAGRFRVPVSAKASWCILIVAPILLAILAAALTRRRKKTS